MFEIDMLSASRSSDCHPGIAVSPRIRWIDEM